MNRIVIPLLLCLLLAFTVQFAVAAKMSHKEYSDLELKDCNDCHKDQGIALTHDNDWAGKHHQSTDWMAEHRAVASKAGTNCTDCHNQGFCLECHAGAGGDVELRKQNFGRDYIPKSHRSDFIQIHPIKARETPRTCDRCHSSQKFCNECHSRFPKGSLRIRSHNPLGTVGQQYVAPNWKSDHGDEARRNLQSCQTCHPDGDVCIQCHSSGKVRPHPRNWKAGNMRDRSNGKVCLKCHLPGTY